MNNINENYPHNSNVKVTVNGPFHKKPKKQQVYLLSTTVCVCVFIGFICTILITSSVTYVLTTDSYTIHFYREKKEPVVPPIAPLKINEDSAASVDVRLPTTLQPIHYLIKLQPFIDQNFSVNAYEEITFKVLKSTSQVVFHMVEITIDEDSITLERVDGSGFGSLAFVDFQYDTELQFFNGTLDGDLKEDVEYIMTFNYEGYLNDDLHGFYRSVYQDENENDVYLATTHFESSNARRAFPCFDEPALKATFEIQILREGNERRAISNMPRIETYEAKAPWKGWYWDIFDVSLQMSSYLVAFSVSDFTKIKSNKNDHVEFRVWAREEAISQAEYALEIGPDVLTFYEEFFDIPFPLPKQDMIALPDFEAGAMENWGLITYRENALLYDPEMGSAGNKQRVGVVVAHELAHQWFGDLVSPEWWTYIWLNEGFASYMEYYGLNAVEPSYDMLDQFFLDNILYALAIDCLESSHPIQIEVQNPDEISEIFDTISYNKGASVIRMMEFFLTKESFQKGLTTYLNELAYSSATTDDLWQYLSDQAHADKTLPDDLEVKTIMDPWTLQMGYPLITVVRNKIGSSATISQERFLLVSSKRDNQEDYEPTYMWYVPITFTTQDDPDFINTYPSYYITDQQTNITIPIDIDADKWFIFNIQSGGFYRVNYENENWNMIFQQLEEDFEVIGITNRAQVIDDAMNLARAGVVTYTLALDSNNYLVNETEYVPWYTALENLNYLEEMFTRSSGYGGLKNFILTLLTPIYEFVGFEDSLNDTHLEQLNRELIMGWACHLQFDSCVEDSTDLYDQWMLNPKNATFVSPNLKSTVFCTGIAEGDEDEWDFAYNQYLTSNYGSDKDYLLAAMGCSKKIWILQRYLDMAFSGEDGIRKQDSSTVFDSVANNDIGRDLAWDYLKKHWDQIALFYGSDTSVADLVLYASSEFNTQKELDEVIALNDEHADDLGTATQSMDQAIDNVGINIDWMKNYYDEINQYLIDNGFGDLYL